MSCTLYEFYNANQIFSKYNYFTTTQNTKLFMGKNVKALPYNLNRFSLLKKASSEVAAGRIIRLVVGDKIDF